MSLSRIAPLCLLSCGVLVSGCQTLNMADPSSTSFDNSLAASAVKGDTYTIEYYPLDDRPEREELALKQGTVVQQVLEETDALKRFRREKLQLYRRNPANNTYSRLDVIFDKAKKRVPPENDYAIRPGDRLVIREDSSTIMDDMLSRFNTGPLNMLRQR